MAIETVTSGGRKAALSTEGAEAVAMYGRYL